METVVFSLKPSKVFSVVFQLIYGCAVIILICVNLPVFIKIVVILAVLLHGWYLWIKYVKREHARSIIKISQDFEGNWIRETVKGHRQKGVLQGDSFIGNWIIILRFRFKNRIESVVIPKDSLSFREYQLLVQRLYFFRAHSKKIEKKHDLL